MPDVVRVVSFERAEKDINDAASALQSLGLTFVTFFAVLIATTSMVTQVELLRGKFILKIPLLNLDVPLLGFFSISPILGLIVQFYFMFHMLLFARRLVIYETALIQEAPSEVDQEALRRQLNNSFFLQYQSGSDRRGSRLVRTLLGALIASGVIVLPIASQLILLLRFLPFHHDIITNEHRVSVIISIFIAAHFWPRYAAAINQHDGAYNYWSSPELDWVGRICVPLLAFILLILAVYPGDLLDFSLTRGFRTGTGFLSTIVGPPGTSLFPTSIDAEYATDVWPPNSKRDLSSRDLVDAKFTGTDLENADLSNADLSGASFRGSNTREGDFTGATIVATDLAFSDLQGASLRDATIVGATFSGAQLQGAEISGTILLSDFDGARLQASTINGTRLFGTSFRRADLRLAFFLYSTLVSTDFFEADLRGANFESADLTGVALFPDQTELDGASFARSRLWRSSINLYKSDDRVSFKEATVAPVKSWTLLELEELTATYSQTNVRSSPLAPMESWTVDNGLEQVRDVLSDQWLDKIPGSKGTAAITAGYSDQLREGFKLGSTPEAYQLALKNVLLSCLCERDDNRRHLASLIKQRDWRTVARLYARAGNFGSDYAAKAIERNISAYAIGTYRPEVEVLLSVRQDPVQAKKLCR